VWCEAEIVEVNSERNRVLVHYSFWSSRWDEWLDFNSPRIQAHGCHICESSSRSRTSMVPPMARQRAVATGLLQQLSTPPPHVLPHHVPVTPPARPHCRFARRRAEARTEGGRVRCAPGGAAVP
jgi:hypothetical protein